MMPSRASATLSATSSHASGASSCPCLGASLRLASLDRTNPIGLTENVAVLAICAWGLLGPETEFMLMGPQSTRSRPSSCVTEPVNSVQTEFGRHGASQLGPDQTESVPHGASSWLTEPWSTRSRPSSGAPAGQSKSVRRQRRWGRKADCLCEGHQRQYHWVDSGTSIVNEIADEPGFGVTRSACHPGSTLRSLTTMTTTHERDTPPRRIGIVLPTI